MTRPIIRLATAAVSLVLLAGCFNQPSGRDVSRESAAQRGLVEQRCADLVVIGARGSTQDGSRNLGVGTEVRMTAESLARLEGKRSGASTHVEAIAYDAAKTSTLDGYLRNVRSGAELLVDTLDEVARECPDSRFALIGFSQGGQVVHTATAQLPRRLVERIGAVAMIADPSRDPDDRIGHWTFGQGDAPAAGRLGAGVAIPADLRDRTISLCVPDDEICNDAGRPGGPPSKTHKEFYEQPSSARETAQQIADILQ